MWGQTPRLSFEMMIISVLLARYGVERVADVGFVESAAVRADRWEGSGRGRFSVEPKPLGIFQKFTPLRTETILWYNMRKQARIGHSLHGTTNQALCC